MLSKEELSQLKNFDEVVATLKAKKNFDVPLHIVPLQMQLFSMEMFAMQREDDFIKEQMNTITHIAEICGKPVTDLDSDNPIIADLNSTILQLKALQKDFALQYCRESIDIALNEYHQYHYDYPLLVAYLWIQLTLALI